MALKTFVFRHANCVPVTGGRADKDNNPHGGPTKVHLPYQPPGSKSENSHGLDRREFVKTCMMAAASVGLEPDQGHEANLLMAHGFLRN